MAYDVTLTYTVPLSEKKTKSSGFRCSDALLRNSDRDAREFLSGSLSMFFFREDGEGLDDIGGWVGVGTEGAISVSQGCYKRTPVFMAHWAERGRPKNADSFRR